MNELQAIIQAARKTGEIPYSKAYSTALIVDGVEVHGASIVFNAKGKVVSIFVED